jgi:YD repeat-containing protein
MIGPIAKTYSYNNSGNRTNDGTNTFSYDSAQRLTSVSFPGGNSAYSLNALGQRILKTGSGGNINFVYDEGGKLIGEYDGTGIPLEETIYLGDLPVAVLR